MNGVDVRVFGIRHHGPGSARRLLAELAAMAPDCILVEGPPDADDLIPWLSHPALVMPVALLIYRPDQPRRATFYPYADFSPEYQALRFGLDRGLTVRFMDLPQTMVLAADAHPDAPPPEAFAVLAEAAGAESYERWWNAAVEQRSEGAGFFEAVLAMMAELRTATGHPDEEDPGQRLALQREASMRRVSRVAINEGFKRVAIVCGAWHAPALVDLGTTKAADEALLADVPTVETAATWVPWTYGRLSQHTGYGAGIASPGWYDHLWRVGQEGAGPTEMSIRWLSHAGELFRAEGLDVSAAHVIEAVRLAEALAAMRGQPYPSLPELNEAVQSVICDGDSEPMKLISRELIVGRRIGTVPPGVPATPLERDLQAQCERLDLRRDPDVQALSLDLREERDLERSYFLHRLALLDIPWGEALKTNEGQGTFQEMWQLRWPPELTLRVVNSAPWGNTVRDAAAAYVEDQARSAPDLPALAALMDRVMLADLSEALLPLLGQIEERAALSYDIPTMMDTLLPLAGLLRYGSLRRKAEHAPVLARVFDHLLVRVCIGLPAACASLDDDAAEAMAARLTAVQSTVRLGREPEQMARWQEAMGALLERRGIHARVAGRACWLLHEAGALGTEALVTHLERAISVRDRSLESVRYAGDWIDGFLRESGLLLVHDRGLWDVLDAWLTGLDTERFHTVLPLLRRTFSTFPKGVRDQLHSRTRGYGGQETAGSEGPAFDASRAEAGLATVAALLGLARVGREARS